MHTTIKLVTSYKPADSLVLLIDDKGTLPKGVFSEKEAQFIAKEIKADKKSIVINQYDRFVAIFRPDKKNDINKLQENCRKAGDVFLASINRNKLEKVFIVNNFGKPEAALALAEGMALGNYQFLKYRKEKKKEEHSLKEIFIVSKGLRAQQVEAMANTVEAVCRARTLVNEPHSWLNATQLAAEFTKLGSEAGFKVTVMNKAQIKAQKMGGLLAVNLGSPQPPTFTVMEWKPRNAKNKKPYVLVGKGVVYDTGGLSLKPTPSSMDYMKSDMAGAAAVACTLYALAKNKVPVHVIALVPATDNRPGGDAYTPGDVITMMSGHTVEVLNTDAEGRLILADALHYAKRYSPELVLDFATLTGAAAMAVGSYGIVCMGNANSNIKESLRKSGEAVYERLAEFPFWDEYDELINSDIADMKNIGGPVGGAITAGKFLQRYVDYPWMHFDIAGPSFLHSPSSYRGKGGTGVAVRFLVDFFTKKNK
jgi:leucyl aminopeptidase